MKKIVTLLLIGLITLCFSTNLHAQSFQQELDQVELMKQAVGTWELSLGKDTVVVMSLKPFGDTFLYTQKFQVNKKTISTSHGIYGYSSDRNRIMYVIVDEKGSWGFRSGKFVTPDKLVVDRYTDDVSHVIGISEYEFQSPESMTMRSKWRGEGMTWDEEWSPAITFRKIK